MQNTIQGTALNCYVDESQMVWSSDDTGKVVCSSEEPEHFVSKLDDVDEVRIIGFPNNADLLVRLYESRNRLGVPQRVRVVSPAFFQKNKTSPTKLLQQMVFGDEFNGYPPSLGGWHELTKADFAMYALVSIMRRETSLTPTVEQVLREHPAWPAVSFVPNGDMLAAAKVLATIVDPRWYVDVKHPTRKSRLRVFLGLTQQNMRRVYYGQGQPGFNWRRCMDVVGAWCRPPAAPAVPAVKGGEPCDFIRRCCARQDALSKGLLRASNLYLTFVSQVWLDSLSQQELFVPEHFFDGDDPEYQALTTEAWREHASQM